MEEKLTIREQILQKKALSKIRAEQRKEEKKKKALLKAQQQVEEKKNKEKQKVIRINRDKEKKEYVIKVRNKVFDNCCELMEECAGLDVSRTYKVEYMQKFNVEGKVEFVKDDISSSIVKKRTSFLKVGNVSVFELSVILSKRAYQQNNYDINVTVSKYNPGRYVWCADRAKYYSKGKALCPGLWKSCRFSYVDGMKEIKVPSVFEECLFLQKSLVSFFSNIVTDESLGKPSKKRSKKIVKEEEPVSDEFLFIDLDEEK